MGAPTNIIEKPPSEVPKKNVTLFLSPRKVISPGIPEKRKGTHTQ
jgi:hypothetical protein